MNPNGTLDVNALSICGVRPVGDCIFGLIDGSAGSDALKVTDSADGRIRVGQIIGGREDCVDVNNHAKGIEVVCELYEPKGDYVITAKGGSRDLTFAGFVRGHGRVVDVDLGNLSDQSDDLTTGVRLNLVHESGEPITVRVLGAEDPVFVNQATQAYRVTFALPRWSRGLFLKLGKQLKKVLPI